MFQINKTKKMETITYTTQEELVEALTNTIAQLQLHEMSASISTVALAQAILASSPHGVVTTHELLNALVPD